jgi:hypothetical protein
LLLLVVDVAQAMDLELAETAVQAVAVGVLQQG